MVGAARFELTTPAPKAGDLPDFPSIESGIYMTRLLELVEMTSYNSRYTAPLHFVRRSSSTLTAAEKIGSNCVAHLHLRQMHYPTSHNTIPRSLGAAERPWAK